MRIRTPKLTPGHMCPDHDGPVVQPGYNVCQGACRGVGFGGNPCRRIFAMLLAMETPSIPPSSASPLSIAQFQQHIRDKYYAADKARGTPATFLWLIEEVGELATALHGTDRANLEEEFADVIAWLCTLANINEVDLESAIRKKYLTGKGPIGTK